MNLVRNYAMKVLKNPEWLSQVGNRIVILRTIKGVRQVELASSLGITTQRLSNYERGTRPVDIEIALDLCEKLDSTLDYLYTGNSRGLPFHVAEQMARLEGRLLAPGGDDGSGKLKN